MRNSLREIERIEEFLHRKMPLPESLVFQAQVLTNPLLRMQTSIQKKIYSLVRLYGRQQAKTEIARVHERLFKLPAHRAFQREISNIFK